MTQEYTLDLALDDAREHISRACDRLDSAQKIEQAEIRATHWDDAGGVRVRFCSLAISHLRAELVKLMGRLP